MTSGRPGPLNLITDVAGLSVGNAEDADALTGVTVVLPDEPSVAACDIRGGAPGTREMDALDPAALVEAIHGVVLSGGSVFGLDAASGAVEWLAGRGVGFTFGAHLPCPVVPAAILFDLANGGDKAWREPPYRALGRAACEAAKREFALGNAGAGLGATAGRFKGGLGSASIVWQNVTVGALVAVNSFGSPADPLTGDLWAGPYAIAGEYPHAHGLAAGFRPPGAWTKADRGTAAGANTTIAVVATDAALTRPEARRLAIMAADGMGRALRPVHTPFDGDSVIALATGRTPLDGPRPLALSALGTLAADTLARAIGRAIWQADAIPGWPAWRDGPDAAD
ncbi:MAG TPA: P1 family peptidase [Aestuariivirgaceae bacterium]|nr:P1 family peptidase [Aestuariivirgaceae bacterium]